MLTKSQARRDAQAWRKANIARRRYVIIAARHAATYLRTVRWISADILKNSSTSDSAIIAINETLSDTAPAADLIKKIWAQTGYAFARRTMTDLANKKENFFSLEDVWTQQVESFLNDIFLNKIVGITETTRTAVLAVVQNGVASGWSIDRIADELLKNSDLANLSEMRAIRIARTEVIGSSNAGSLFGAQQMNLGDRVKKKWLVALDGRERTSHRNAHFMYADGIPLLDNFTVGDAHLSYPGDPNGTAKEVVNCRCAIGYVTPFSE